MKKSDLIFGEYESVSSQTILLCRFPFPDFFLVFPFHSTEKTLWSVTASELYRRSDRRLSGKLVPTFADRECHVGRLCGLVVRVLGYKSGEPGSIPGTTRKKVMGLEQGPLSLVSTTDELLDRKVAAPV
jgi:hypothetical protein